MFWQTAYNKLNTSQKLVLLYVIFSDGSSPGRQGFKMLVGEDDFMLGSIGGGIMEHKLVELARSNLASGSFPPFCKQQLHRTDESQDRSGMICSGEQKVAFYYLGENELAIIREIVSALSNRKSLVLSLNQFGITIAQDINLTSKCNLTHASKSSWQYNERIDLNPRIFIIGAGHIGLALSKLMHFLNFETILIDDREQLNTLLENDYVDQKLIVDYNNISEQIDSDQNDYFALMTFGYRTDKIVVKELIENPYKYFGVLGSKNKMTKLLKELEEEGIDRGLLEKLNTPIGIDIKSQTPEEIAISVAAEIIAIKNKELK